MIIFKKPGFKLDWNCNWPLNGYILHLSEQIKYIAIFLERFLNSYYQSNLLMQKLAIAIGILPKVRYHVKEIELQNIYHTIFESHKRCHIWFQSNSAFIKDNYRSHLQLCLKK